MKKHLEVFEAMIDPARKECWDSDIKEGPSSVDNYALNAMGIGLNESEQVFIYELLHNYIIKHDSCNTNCYEQEFEAPLLDYK